MSKLIYSMLASLDGFVEDAEGGFGWAAPSEEVHAYANAIGASVGTYLYGQRMYETMLFWETAHELPELGDVEREWARLWRGTEKIVYSTTLDAPHSERTRIEPAFDPRAVRALVAGSERDVAIAGPGLAAGAIAAGFVDEVHVILAPVVVGDGKRLFRVGSRLDLRLVDQRAVSDGFVALRRAPMSQPDVAVRIAVAADADALERAGTDVFDNDVERTWLTAFFDNPANLLAIALAAGEVVGMASGVAYVHPDKPLQLFVNEVGVAERFQRRRPQAPRVSDSHGAREVMECVHDEP
jgi:dihydrofolate reductase